VRVFLLCLSLLTSTAYAARSPIIYGSSGGVTCAYNLITQSCLSSASASGVAGGVQLSDGSSGFTAEPTLLFWSTTDNRLGIGTNAPSRDLTISSAGEPTIMFTTSSAAANTKHWQYTVSTGSWYVQAMNDALAGSTGMVLNRSAGTATTVGWSSTYTNCTALTTNGSNVMGCTASDERLKKDIVPYERGLEAIAGLQPKTFKHSAFIAQNVAKTIPEAVRIAPNGDMQLDYWTIIATQANAINELRLRLEALEGNTAKFIKKPIPLKPLYKIVAHEIKVEPKDLKKVK
jgi:hypothetical protein